MIDPFNWRISHQFGFLNGLNVPFCKIIFCVIVFPPLKKSIPSYKRTKCLDFAVPPLLTIASPTHEG